MGYLYLVDIGVQDDTNCLFRLEFFNSFTNLKKLGIGLVIESKINTLHITPFEHPLLGLRLNSLEHNSKFETLYKIRFL